jgi:hypothetical protein
MDEEEAKHAEIMESINSYYRVVGKVAYSWNMLQMHLGWVFERTISQTDGNILNAIWHSQQSDRNQRRMLRAAISAGAFSHIGHKLPATAKDDLLWLLKEADALSARRDEALHSPVAFQNVKKSDKGTPIPVAFWLTSNPLAERLRNKNLMGELSLSAWRADKLSEFTIQIHSALHTSRAWPDKRPELSRELHHQQMGLNPPLNE